MNKKAMLLAGTPETLGFMIEVLADGTVKTNFPVKRVYSSTLDSHNVYTFSDLALGILDRAAPISPRCTDYNGRATPLIEYPDVFVSQFAEFQFRVLAKHLMSKIDTGTITLTNKWIVNWINVHAQKKHSLDLEDLSLE